MRVSSELVVLVTLNAWSASQSTVEGYKRKVQL